MRIKEKPKYNIWQNSCYAIRYAWKQDKMVIFVMLVQILLAVYIPVLNMFFPKMVASQVISKAGMSVLICTVLVFTIANMGLNAVKTYLDGICSVDRTSVRLAICFDKMRKAITTDYANMEEQSFLNAKQKVNNNTSSNWTSTERIYYTFVSMGTNVIGFVVYLFVLVSIHPFILLLTAMTATLGAVVRKWTDKWQHDHDKESAVFNKKLWYVNDIGSNHALSKDIRLFGMKDWINDISNANLKLAYDFSRKVGIRRLLADAVDCVAAFARDGIAYAYLVWQVLFHGMAVDNFILLFAAIGGFSGWVIGILSDYTTLSMHSLNYCRIREYFEYPDKFKSKDGISIKPEQNQSYTLQLKNVTFRYSGAEEDTLQNINLTIHAGEKLAVVGMNGAGKTTLVKLLCGFYDPTEGEVLLNGVDIRTYNRTDYYTLFTAVFQEFNILPTTIAENISLEEEDQINEDKIKRCLLMADIEEKIDSLPLGIHSLLLKDIHDDAVELSGGETQKLMLARALYKDSPILILDEPTAALDPIAESRLYDKYNELSSGKTSVYISHRLASTRFCDRIILIGDKKIQEIGSHSELMKENGRYAELFNIQSRYYQYNVDEEVVVS